MSTTPRTRGPYAKTAEQRRRILDVAVDVFGRRGNRGSSLREIADKVGLSQAGVLHHFGSKSALLMAVLEQRDEAVEEAPDTLEGQVAAARALLDDATSHPGLTQLFTTVSAEATDPDHPAHDFIVARYERTAGEFAASLRRAQETGEISADVDVEAGARLVMAAMDGLQLQQLLNPDLDVVASFDLLVAALIGTFGQPKH